MEKQAHGGKFAAVGARSWCTAIPDETPTVPGRRLMRGPANSRTYQNIHDPTARRKVSMDRLQ